MVKKAEVQQFLANYTNQIYDNIWLGGRYNAESSRFEWSDGEPLTYTNWNEGYPRNTSDMDTCIELKPMNAKTPNDIGGKWEDAPCQRRNLALCQRTLSWTLSDAVDVIISLREELFVTRELLGNMTRQMEAVSKSADEAQKSADEAQKSANEAQNTADESKQVSNEAKERSDEANRNALTANQKALEALNKFSECVTSLRFGVRESGDTHDGPGFNDMVGYIITGVWNHNSDEFIDNAFRRQVFLQKNGKWVNADWL